MGRARPRVAGQGRRGPFERGRTGCTGAIACATNAPISEWGATFTDPRLAAAVVDRLTFNAHIIQTGTTSYRLHTSRTRKGPHH